jgi:hypothetical protein
MIFNSWRHKLIVIALFSGDGRNTGYGCGIVKWYLTDMRKCFQEIKRKRKISNNVN